MWRQARAARELPQSVAPGVVLDAFDFISLSLSVAGLIVTIAGFGIAYVQIGRTKKAVDAVASNAAAGTKRVRYNQLLILVPQLQSFEVEFDSAISAGNSLGVEQVLVRWRQVASQASGVLSPMGDPYAETVETLEKALNTARSLKSKLATASGKVDLASQTSGPRRELSAATDNLAQVVGGLSTQVPESETP